MWLSESKDSNHEFIWFFSPRCNSKSQLFYVFGVLCAKTININTFLPFPLSVEFFRLTMKDLTKYVEISYGYQKFILQVSILFEFLTEFDNDQKSLFVKCITVREKLQIGGLASLQPKLADAKR